MRVERRYCRAQAELERAKKPAGFCTQGSSDFDGVQISIDGVGPLRLPFRTADARKLSQVAVQANIEKAKPPDTFQLRDILCIERLGTVGSNERFSLVDPLVEKSNTFLQNVLDGCEAIN